MQNCCKESFKKGYTQCTKCGQMLIPYGPKQVEIIFVKQRSK